MNMKTTIEAAKISINGILAMSSFAATRATIMMDKTAMKQFLILSSWMNPRINAGLNGIHKGFRVAQ